MNEVSVLIGADVVPALSNHAFFLNGRTCDIFDGVISDIWENADVRVFNLETPLYDGPSQIEKCGPHLKSPTASIHGLKMLSPNLVLLANNHIMDSGFQGLDSTIEALNSERIDYVGVGHSLKDMRKSRIIEKDGLKIAFYNCAEKEFSIATDQKSGANPFDFIDSFDDVAELKRENDFVVVCYHGGKEFYPYPSPELQRIFRKFSDEGADVVVAQHTHCVGCYETYKNSTLIYGQGNFLFDMKNSQYVPYGLLIRLFFTKEKCRVEYVPLSFKQGKLFLLEDGSSCLLDFLSRSEQIKEEGFVEKKYNSFARGMFPYYLRVLKGNSFFQKILYKLLGPYYTRISSKDNLLAVQNFIECDAHRELLLEGLKWKNQ